MKSIFTLLLFISITVSSYAQFFERIYLAPDSIFPCYHENNTSFGMDLISYNDTNYILTRFNAGYYDSTCIHQAPVGYGIIRTDMNGDTLSQFTYLSDSYITLGNGEIRTSDFTLGKDDQLYVTGVILDTTYSCYLAQHSLNGSRNWFKKYTLPQGANPYGIFADSTGIYTASHTSGSYNPGEKLLITKHDLNGNLQWTASIDTSYFARNMQIIPLDDNYAVISNIIPVTAINSLYIICMIKFTGAGNIYDTKFIGNTTYGYLGADAVYNTSGNICISSNVSTGTQDELTFLEIDTSGNILSQFQDATNYPDHLLQDPALIQSSDGNYIIGGRKLSYHTVLPSPVGYGSGIFMRKYTPTGTLLWETEFAGELMEMQSLDNNEQIFTGFRLNDTGLYQVLVIKTNSLGFSDSCRLKFSSALGTLPITIAENTPMAFVNESTGAGPFQWYINDSLISTNLNTYFYTEDPGMYTVYLVGCGDSISTTVNVTSNTFGIPEEESGLMVFPNPCTDILNISSKQHLNNQVLYMYTVSGQLIATHQLLENTQINMLPYSPGIYIYEIRDNKERVYRGKIIRS